MKRIYLLLIISLISLNVWSQTFDDIIIKKVEVDCGDVSKHASTLIQNYYQAEEIDSLYLFLDYWESKCGLPEVLFRLRNLLDIKNNKLQTDSISPVWVEYLIPYKTKRDNYTGQIFKEFLNYYIIPYEKSYQSIDSLTIKLANTLIPKNIDEELLIDFYKQENPTFEKIKKSSRKESRLSQSYEEVYSSTIKIPQSHFAFISGFIIPTGNLKFIGFSPTIGAVFGYKKQKHNYDFIADFRIVSSSGDYSVVYQDSLITLNSLGNMYLGFEYTYDFINSQKFDLGISPGIGFDRINALTKDNNFGEKPKHLPSFNFNTGIVFKYKYGKLEKYLGLHARYNWVNYHNPGGTDLSGGYFNLRLTWGGLAGESREEKLFDLR